MITTVLATSAVALAQKATPDGTGRTPATEIAATGPEDATRQQVGESERLRAMQIDAQSVATEKVAQALAEQKRLTTQQAASLERLQRADAAVKEMTGHMLDLNHRRAGAQARIDKRVAALRPILPVILRMSTWPVETLLGAQVPAEDSVRGLLVLRGIARQAEADARALVEERGDLDAATNAAAAIAPRLDEARTARTQEANGLARQLADAIDRRETAEREAAGAARQAAAEAARASSLRSMLQILETQRGLEEARAGEDLMRAEREQKDAAVEAARLRQAAVAHPAGTGTLSGNAKPAGQILLPITGTLVRAWGEADHGEVAAGQLWRSEAGARVVAPCGGTVAFAEPFRGYGMLVIIDCGGSFHTIMGGLDKVAVVPGQPVAAGDSIGSMGAAPLPASSGVAPRISSPTEHSSQDARLSPGVTLDPSLGRTPDGPDGANRSASPAGPEVTLAAPTLYFELRKAGRAIDPAPWLKQAGG